MNYYIAESSDYADIAAIHDNLYSYNLTKTGAQRVEVQANRYPEASALILRDDAGNFYGGAAYHWENDPRHVIIDYFFTAEAVRGQGWGRKIFARLEEIVRQNGGEYMTVTTNSFQAPGFYLGLGFEQISENAAPCPLLPDNIHYKYRKKF